MQSTKGAQLTPMCPYCGNWSKKVTGKTIYPHRRDLCEKVFYQCAPCHAYVGTHPGSTKPLGRLADAELRKAKSATHRAFDPLWREQGVFSSRKNAYAWLAGAMGIPRSETHVGMFDLEQCHRAERLCAELAEQHTNLAEPAQQAAKQGGA